MMRTHLINTLISMTALVMGLAGCSTLGSRSTSEKTTPPIVDESKPATRIHPLFGDNAILQQGMPLPIWGWDHPGREVVVTLAGNEATTITDEEGRWMVTLAPSPAGGPHEIHVAGSGELVRQNIMVGEVWLASGQSNMEWPVRESDEHEEALEAVDQVGEIRVFSLEYQSSVEPRHDLDDTPWIVATRETVADLAAVPWWFAHDIQKETGVPVGVVDATWGGTSITTWISRETLDKHPRAGRMAADAVAALEQFTKDLEQYRIDREAWRQKATVEDPGNEGEEKGWHLPDHDTTDWQLMDLPRYWQADGLEINGAVWFRRVVDLPGEWEGRELELHLGPIDDFDTTYLNGTIVGRTGRETQGFWAHPRVYHIDADLVKAGPNTLAVRVFDIILLGGFAGDPGDMRLFPKDNPEAAISLAGKWSYRVEYGVEPYTEPSPVAPRRPEEHTLPAGPFNGMIHPLAPFGVRGILWYQGESDTHDPGLFSELFPMLIKDWRQHWQDSSLPFHFVQLPPWIANTTGVPLWAHLRQAQLDTWRDTPNTGMVVTTDAGDPHDIHPRRKRVVGERLARLALHHQYGIDIVPMGPVYHHHEIEGSTIRIHFDHVGGGLTIDGDEITGFEISGVNQIFFPATARIEGNTVVVESDSVSAPVAVRHGWSNLPRVTLQNSAQLPASPFRTDRW